MRFLAKFSKLLILLSILGLGMYIIMPTSSEAAATSMTFNPVADAYVYSNKPDANNGSAPTLRVDGSPVMRSYIRFDLSSLSDGLISSAILKVYANSSLNDGFSIDQLANNTWQEDTLIYENAPTPGPAITNSGDVASGQWVSIDITPYIKGAGIYSLVFTALSSTQLNLASRESESYAPQLIVTQEFSPTATYTPTQVLDTPTSSPTNTPTSIPPTSTPTAIPTNTPIPIPSTSTPTPVPTNTPTPVPPTSTPTPVPTNTPTPTAYSPTLAPTQASPVAISTTFAPSADAYVYSGYPDTNFGLYSSLYVDESPAILSYMRFDLSSLDYSTIDNVTLRIYANSSLGAGFELEQLTDNTWQEDTIDYANAPAPGQSITQSGPVSTNSWISIDLTSYINGPGIYSLVLFPLSSTRVNLASRESGSHAPQLIISGSSSSLPKPTNTPTSTSTSTFTPTPTHTSEITPTPTYSSTPTSTSTSTFTPTPTLTSEITPTPTNSSTPAPTSTSTFTPAPTQSNTPMPTPTSTSTLTPAPTQSNTPTPTSVPSSTPTSTAAPSITPTPTSTSTAGGVPNFSHIILIILENREYSSVVGNSSWPNFNNLASNYALLTQSYAVAHPSLPNYIALTSGSTQGITSDCTSCFVNATNLGDILEQNGKSWKGYMEDMPSPCYVGNSGDYVQKHNPFIYYDDIRTNSNRCASHVVPLTQFDTDLSNNQLPDFSWITPNLCNDGHDCSSSISDSFLGSEVSKILASPSFDQNSLLIITFDEGSSGSSCCGLPSSAGGHIATLFISSLAKAGYQDSTSYDHYSILKLMADAWGLPYLEHVGDSSTNSITDVWK
jgi:hypothetical protein